MQVTWLLEAVAVVIPLITGAIIWRKSADISERHHSHHDTYVIAITVSWGVVTAILLMGALGLLLGWLCGLGVFSIDIRVVLAFFDAFLVTAFVSWCVLCRYKVVTFDDHMQVTPFFGPEVDIAYDSITSMQWISSVLVPGGRNITVFVGQRRRAVLRAMLDLDQILIRINRFEVLESVIL